METLRYFCVYLYKEKDVTLSPTELYKILIYRILINELENYKNIKVNEPSYINIKLKNIERVNLKKNMLALIAYDDNTNLGIDKFSNIFRSKLSRKSKIIGLLRKQELMKKHHELFLAFVKNHETIKSINDLSINKIRDYAEQYCNNDKEAKKDNIKLNDIIKYYT